MSLSGKKMKKKNLFKKNILINLLLSIGTLTSMTYSIESLAAIYKCNLPDGSVAYSNDKKASRDCSVTNLDNSSNFSVIATPSVSALNKEANYYASVSTSNKNFPKLGDGTNTNYSTSTDSVTPANVNLTVSEATQTKRDETRNSILQKELDAEQKTLDDNKLELAGLVKNLGKSLGDNKNDSLNEQTSDKIAKLQQSIEMHGNNILALNKELKKPDSTVRDDKTDAQRANTEALKVISTKDTNQDDLNKIASLEKQINNKNMDSKQMQDAIAVKNSVANSNVAQSLSAKNNTDVVSKIKEISKDMTNNSSINSSKDKNKETIKNFINK